MTNRPRSFLSLQSPHFCLLVEEVIEALTPSFVLWGHSQLAAFGVVAIVSCLFCFFFVVAGLVLFWSCFGTARAMLWTCSLFLPIAFWAPPRLPNACLSPHSSTTALLWTNLLPWQWAWKRGLGAMSTGICLVTLCVYVLYAIECLHFWSSRMWELICCKVACVWPRGRKRHEVALFWSR